MTRPCRIVCTCPSELPIALLRVNTALPFSALKKSICPL